jgi:hypothetical protein
MQQPFSNLIGGQHGTCDQGGCHNPADFIQDGLACCSECLRPPEFRLQNETRKPTAPPLFEPLPKGKQIPLLSGLNCLPGQKDLWEDLTAN